MTGETIVLETERKYEVSPDLQSDALVQVTGYANQGMEELDLAAEYFDTEDLRLLRAGVTLRRRTGGHDAGWHLKLPEGRDSRTEVQLPLSEGIRPPHSFLEATQVYSVGAELVPVATLNTRRLRWPLVDVGGHDVAELVDDVVSALPAGVHTAPRTWREVEVELSEGIETSVLDVIEARLSSLGLHRARNASKLERALEHRIPARAPSPARTHRRGKANAGEVVVEYLRAQVEAFRHFDPLARQGQPDAVHQMRVAARRMRGALQSFGDVFDHDQTGKLIGELRWIAGELAPARDVEVTGARFTDVLTQLAPDLKVGAVETDMRAVLQVRTAQANEAAITALTCPRYLELHRSIDTLFKHPPHTRRARLRAAPTLTDGIRRAFGRLEDRMADLELSAAGPERQVALHEVRKAAKRLRCATEVAAPVLGKPVIRLRKRVGAVQTVLGDHQDAVVACSVLLEFGGLADETGGHGFTYGVMHGIETARATAAEQGLRATWRRTRSAAL